MIKANTLTFEQVEPAFHKWARYFCNKYPKKFDYWELINSAWAYGTTRLLPQSKIKFASARVKYDMIDYMRKVSRQRVMRYNLARGNSLPCFYNFSDTTSKSNVEGGADFETTLEAQSIDVEGKDLVRFLTGHSSLSRTENLIMRLMYIEGFGQKAAGKVCGFDESRISQIHTNIMARLRCLDYTKITGRIECQQQART